MDYLIVCIAALVAAALTLFSGFGLGTLLLPVFAIFFPLPAAVAATAVVHLVNNVFKLTLVGRDASREAVLRFGVPAALTALIGAWLFNLISGAQPLTSYTLAGRECEVTFVKLMVGVMIVVFAIMEIVPKWSQLGFNKKYLPLGGALSGFFGGLSGNQGALRSAFLLKAGLTKEEFVGTGVVAAVIVDTARLIVYGAGFYSAKFEVLSGRLGALVLAATIAACVGSVIATRLLKKVTFRIIQLLVGVMLIVLGLALGAGIA